MNTATNRMPANSTTTVPLWRLAHGRTGDKGDISNISVIAWNSACWEVVQREVTAERVAAWFADRQPRHVTRHVLAGLEALNFIIEGVLDGGVNDALNLDAHGKALSFFLLDMPIAVTPELAATLPDLGDPPG